MSESIITDVYVGKFVLIQLVDTTVELTVENNVYSLSEANNCCVSYASIWIDRFTLMES